MKQTKLTEVLTVFLSLIIVYPVLPTILDSTSNYGNWAQELMTHEFTHILNIEPANGIFHYLRKIFGSIVRPNALVPRWYLEGLAVELETRFTKMGRLRSPFYSALSRALVESDSLTKEDISRINETRIPTFPTGGRPYFMGALLWDHLVEQFGIKTVFELNDSFSRRIPFTIDGAAKNSFDKEFSVLLSETYAAVEEKANTELAVIRADKPTIGNQIPRRDEVTAQHSPALSPDGKKLLFVQKSTDNSDEIVLFQRKNRDDPFDWEKPTILVSKKGNQSSRLVT